MLGLFFILSSVKAKCEDSCFLPCLSTSDLTTCSKSCCSFDNILFEDDKIFYVSEGEKIEIEVDPVFIEIPSVPVEVKSYPAEVVEPATIYPDPVTCEDKCLNYCKKTGPKCVEVCRVKHCSSPQPEASNTWTKLLVSVVVVVLIFACFKPKEEETGYVRLA
jgi:hypothetical protein